jgi:hypothetical protein
VTTLTASNPTAPSIELSCHPATPCAAVQSIRIHTRRTGTGLELRYRVEGDIERLVIPAPTFPNRADGLWQHTCLEAFVREASSNGYVELNFSPSGEWAMYEFSGYRDGRANVEAARPPRICVHHDRRVLQLDAVVDLDCIPALLDGELTVALSAVIEETNARISYWALAHPVGKPDFHHSVGFALRIAR